MNKTKIEWVKNPDGTQGYTWNPTTGCLNHNDGMCKGGDFPCYAYRLAHGRLKARYLMNKNCAPVLEPPMHYISSPKNQGDPFYPRFWISRAGEPYHHKDSRGIFVCDMGELFGDWLPNSWQESVFTTIRDNPQHRFYLLTKQPQNLIKFSPFPDNCFVGFAATDNQMLQYGLAYMSEVEAKIKYVSFEPLLGQIVFPTAIDQLDLVIIGAQTKPLKLPKPEWVREIITAANTADVPIFIKNNIIDNCQGEYRLGSELRQEMPDGV